MTDYSAFGQVLPSGTSAFADSQISLGLQFTVTSSGCTFPGYWLYVPAGASTTGSVYSAALFTTTNGTSGSAVTGGAATGSGTFTAGAWNEILVGTPPSLSTGTTYVAAVCMPFSATATYQAEASYWSTGGGASGFVNGPLTVPAPGAALGGATQRYSYGSSAIFPATSTTTLFVMDVDVAGATGTNATVTMSSFLAVTSSVPAVQAGSLTTPAWATSYGIVSGGTGSWSNPANAEGTGGSGGPWATWTAP